MFNAKAIDSVYLHANDNVCVAARDLPAETQVSAGGRTVKLVGPVKLGHKIALDAIAADKPVVKYGQIIGFATEAIAPGTWIHTHNLTAGQFARDYAAASEIPPDPTPLTGRTFQGYRRPDGKAGTRNYIAVISTVNCSASVSKYVAARFNAESLKQFPNVDGVVAFTHGGGCGMQFGGEGHATLNRVMGGIARHPNIGGYVLIGLGCETATLGYLLDDQKLVQIGGGKGGSPKRPHVLSMQDVGGTTKTIEAACQLVGEMLPRANDVAARGDSAFRIDPGHQLRRIRRQLGHHGQPGLGRSQRHDRGGRRHRDPGRDDRDLRRRTIADSPRPLAPGRAETDRPHPVVGVVHRVVRLHARQQSLARQQGRRA